MWMTSRVSISRMTLNNIDPEAARKHCLTNHEFMTEAVKYFWLLLFFVFDPSFDFAANNSRSDSVDVTDYDIHLNVTDYAGKTISGYTIVSFKSKINDLSFIDLDLLKLNIDSVTQNNQQTLFAYDDSTTIRVNLESTLNTGDSTAVTVYYHGKPKEDSGGWGGWYWSGDYSFSISVALTDIPHNYGHSWFPCIDNWVERATYHFSIITPSDKMALCNGELTSSITNNDGTKTWNWQLLQTIPSYLACVSVNKYTPAYGKFLSVSGDTIPVQYGAIASDTTKMKNSFIHLPNAFATFEQCFGPYRWNKVGYCETTVGSMEHATNISYPYFAVNGQTTDENYMAHELSHHWFGNLVTCRTAEDMWLNEGWADFCMRVFFEQLDGEQKYKELVAANHEYCVHYLHTSLADGTYFTMNNIPETNTYGPTTYDKGSDMVHTLRGYMGDSLFFHCLADYCHDYAFKDASSVDLRDYLSSCSGIDLTDFFNDWIFSPGWPAFTIDSVDAAANQVSGYDVTVFLRQRLDHAPHFYQNVPLEISFYNEDGTIEKHVAIISGACSSYSVHLSFNPVFTGLDLDAKISDAVTADLLTVKNTGSVTATYGKMTLNVSSVNDSALVRIEHVYAAPDPFKNPVPGLHISQERFWKVNGIFPDGFDASASILYNGTNASGGFLDNQLISNSEDSLRVLYRSSPASDWQIETDVTQNFQGSHTDKRGSFNINHLKKGEYALGIFQNNKVDSILNFPDSCLLTGMANLQNENENGLSVFPNPADESITIRMNNGACNCQIEIYNLYGIEKMQERFDQDERTVSLKKWVPGIYFLKILNEKNEIVTLQKLIIN